MWPFNPKQEKPDEQIKKDRQKWLDGAIVRSAKLKKLITDNKTGWAEVVILLDEYIQACKKRKVATDLSVADDATIQQLRLMDESINLCEWFKKIPEQFIGKVEGMLTEQKEKEENGNA